MASRRGVKTLSPQGAIKPTGTWSLGARAGDFVFVAGMRGIDPASNTIVADRGRANSDRFHEHENDRQYRKARAFPIAFV